MSEEEKLMEEAELVRKKYENHINDPIIKKEQPKGISNKEKSFNIESLLDKDSMKYPLVKDKNVFDPIYRVYKKIKTYVKSGKGNPQELKYYKDYIKNVEDKILGPNIRLSKHLAIGIMNTYGNLCAGLNMELNDLTSEGLKGLMRAWERYNPSKGAKFGSFAGILIKQAIHKAIADKSRIIKLPLAKQHEISKLNKDRNNLEQKLGRKSTNEELSNFTGFSIQKIDELEICDKNPVSLELLIFDDKNNVPVLNLIPDERYLPDKKYMPEEINNKREYIKNFIEGANLTKQEKDILYKRVKGKKLKEIGKDYNVTKQGIEQIEKKALKKVKNYCKRVKRLEKIVNKK